jgi:predicted secreted hydrolase
VREGLGILAIVLGVAWSLGFNRAVPLPHVSHVSHVSNDVVQPGWRAAAPGYPWSFPRDHAAHPDFRIEWWYYTGNLDAVDGRRFGYQVTFFRIGIDPAPANPSRWAVRDVYMTHLAVSDPSGRRYRVAERLSRAGPGLAGAEVGRYRVWNGDWEASRDEGGRHVLRLSERGLGVDLVLGEGKPPVLNGQRGYSRKGPSEGNASLYYSLTRMPTQGALTIDGERVEVTGASWMDREFGTNFLEADQVGWDWLSLQLSDGNDLMIYQLRQRDGSRDPHSSGTLTRPDGGSVVLSPDEFALTAAGPTYRSGATGAIYPVAWRIEIPSRRIVLDVSTPLSGQELDFRPSTGVAYWEGLVDVSGTTAGRPVTGRGYLEMTGYAGDATRFLAAPR